MELTVIVLSDLHATSDKNSGDTYLFADPKQNDPDLFKDLDDVISEQNITADLIICPGDICDRGNSQGFTFAWGKLQKLRNSLGALDLIATCGNHDLDSRFRSASAFEDPDPKGELLQADPPFPFGDTEDTNFFWARNYVVRQPIPNLTVIVLNTSAYHGGLEEEIEYGRVSMRTINSIKGKLSSFPETEMNILVCHHNLQPLKSWDLHADDQFVKKGYDLISELTEHTGKPWIVIHGHRHIPNVSFSVSPPFATIGAASFGKKGDAFNNQFHLIKLVVDGSSSSSPIKGEIHSWNWSRAKKWAQYLDPSKGFPPHCGFGFNGGISYLTTSIKSALGDEEFLSWSSILDSLPDLRYLTPEQNEKLIKDLDRKGMSVTPTHGTPQQIGKKK